MKHCGRPKVFVATTIAFQSASATLSSAYFYQGQRSLSFNRWIRATKGKISKVSTRKKNPSDSRQNITFRNRSNALDLKQRRW